MSYSTVEQVMKQLMAFQGYYVSHIALEATQTEDDDTSIRITMKPQDILDNSNKINIDNTII